MGPCMITEDGECTTEFRTRLNRRQAIEASVQKMWQSHSIQISTKIRLMKALMWPVATYGCERRTLRKYCDEHVCVSVCLSVCLSAKISRTTHAIFTVFLCIFPMAAARFPSGGVTKSQELKGNGQFGGFSSTLTMHYTA